MSPQPLAYPYGRHLVEQDDIDAVTAVLRGSLLTAGPVVGEFESKFAKAVDAGHAVACSSGSTALYLALRAIGIGSNSVVVVPSITYVATANAARLAGANVVFSDVNPTTGLMGPEELSEACEHAGGRVDCAMPVHFAGQTANLAEMQAVAARSSAVLVEDACHALATVSSGHVVGSCRHSEATVFSLHPVKTIAGGEGGVVTTNNEETVRNLRMLRENGVVREHGRFVSTDLSTSAAGTSNRWYHEFHDVSLNYRLSEIHSALAMSQLGKLSRFASERRRIAAAYRTELADLTPLVVPIGSGGANDPCLHLQVVLIDFTAAGVERERVMARLAAVGIGTQVHYIPVHRQPSYAHETRRLPGADAFYSRCLSLPLFVGMNEDDVRHVVRQLRVALDRG